MKLCILTLSILILQYFGATNSDTSTQRNVNKQRTRISSSANGRNRLNNNSQFRQAVPVPPTPPTPLPPPVPEIPPPATQMPQMPILPPSTQLPQTPIENNVNCSQTVDVTSGNIPQYQFVVGAQNLSALHCVITIFGQRGRRLGLQFTEADIQPGLFDCDFDSVQVYSLSTGKLIFKDKFCNLSHPSQEIITENNAAVLTFNSINLQRPQGFKVQIRSVNLDTHENETTTETHYGYGNGDYTSYGYGTSSHTGYYTDYNRPTHYRPTDYNTPIPNGYPNRFTTDYNTPIPNGYPNRFTNYTNYGPPSYTYPNPKNISTGYGVPPNPNTHYYAPPKINYKNGNDCDKEPWKITDRSENNYGGKYPPKSHYNNDFYTWLTTATKGSKWSKEMYNTPQSGYSITHSK